MAFFNKREVLQLIKNYLSLQNSAFYDILKTSDSGTVSKKLGVYKETGIAESEMHEIIKLLLRRLDEVKASTSPDPYRELSEMICGRLSDFPTLSLDAEGSKEFERLLAGNDRDYKEFLSRVLLREYIVIRNSFSVGLQLAELDKNESLRQKIIEIRKKNSQLLDTLMEMKSLINSVKYIMYSEFGDLYSKYQKSGTEVDFYKEILTYLEEYPGCTDEAYNAFRLELAARINEKFLSADREKDIYTQNSPVDISEEEKQTLENDIREFKKTWRRLVKRIHPDINPQFEGNEQLREIYGKLMELSETDFFAVSTLYEIEEQVEAILNLDETLLSPGVDVSESDYEALSKYLEMLQNKKRKLHEEIDKLSHDNMFVLGQLVRNNLSDVKEKLQKDIQELIMEKERTLSEIIKYKSDFEAIYVQ